MNKLLTLTAAAAMIAAGSSSALAAASATTSTDITANANKSCEFSATSVASAVLEGGPITPSGDVSKFTLDFGDITGVGIAKTKVEVEYEVACNYKFNISLRSIRGGLKNNSAPTPASPFAGCYNYEAFAEYTGSSTVYKTPTLEADCTTSPKEETVQSLEGAVDAPLFVYVEFPADSTIPFAGAFKDTLVLKIGNPL